MIKISIESNINQVVRGLDRMAREQVPLAAAKAINAVAKKIVEAENTEVRNIFDRPTPTAQYSSRVFKWASKNNLRAEVGLKDFIGKGIPASKFLLAQITGGQRAPKRFELALQKKELMPTGYVALFAKRSNYLDSYGNLPGPKIVQILSYFQAFGEQGYRANMTGKRKDAMRAGKVKGMKWGMVYFRGGKDVGLPDGIWERHYPNGQAGKSFIKPVLIYVPTANYKKRFDFAGVARKTAEKEFAREFDSALTEALQSAK